MRKQAWKIEKQVMRYSVATFLHIRAIVVFYIPGKIFSNLVTYYLGLPFPFDMNFISLSLFF